MALKIHLGVECGRDRRFYLRTDRSHDGHHDQRGAVMTPHELPIARFLIDHMFKEWGKANFQGLEKSIFEMTEVKVSRHQGLA